MPAFSIYHVIIESMWGEKIVGIFNKTFAFKVRNLDIEPTYWQAGAIVLLLFLLVWTVARIRYLYVHWSLGKSSIAFLFWGFVIALILEGFLLLGGRTIFTEILGWNDAPKPFSTALDIGRERLVETLETDSEKVSRHEDVIKLYNNLDDVELQKVKQYICE